MSKQKLFDIVVQHARKQGCKSRKSRNNEDGQCMYRGSGGTKCFVGALIDDEYYREEFDYGGGQLVTDAGVQKAITLSVGIDVYNGELEETDLLVRLQQVHDNTLLKHWEVAFENLATEFGLTLPAGEL